MFEVPHGGMTWYLMHSEAFVSDPLSQLQIGGNTEVAEKARALGRVFDDRREKFGHLENG
jgi:hypothetical protein